jgi:hypothetical protein
MIVSALSLALSPASAELALAYDVNPIMINMAGIVFTATFVPMTFAGMWMYKAWRTQTVLRIASIMMIVGGGVRMYTIVNGKFWPVLVGQTIISLA